MLLLCVLGSCPNACWCFSTPKIARGVSRAVPEGAFGGVWWQNARPHRLPRAHEARSTLKSSGHACSLHGGQASDRLACGPVAGCLDVPVAGTWECAASGGQWFHHPVHWPVVASGFAVCDTCHERGCTMIMPRRRMNSGTVRILVNISAKFRFVGTCTGTNMLLSRRTLTHSWRASM